jgi:allantoin racemase
MATLRIWHQSMAELDVFPAYRDALGAHLHRLVGDQAEVVLHGAAPGTYDGVPPIDVLNYPFAFHTLLQQMLENAIRAEDEGYDAFVISSYTEPFLTEARAAVDIPVVAMPESTLLTACSVAKQSAIITVGPEIGWLARGIIERHGLQARVAGIFPVSPPVSEPAIVRSFDDPSALLTSFHTAAAAAIEAGADVLIPAEGILNEVCVAHGLRDIDGVSVMDAVGVAFEHALMMCRLRAGTGLHAGRRWTYRRPPAETMARLRAR